MDSVLDGHTHFIEVSRNLMIQIYPKGKALKSLSNPPFKTRSLMHELQVNPRGLICLLPTLSMEVNLRPQ